MFHINGAVFGAHACLAEQKAMIFSEKAPRVVVRVVVEERHHHLVARLHAARERAAQLKVERRHVGAELHRLLRRVEKILGGAVRRIFDCGLRA